MWSGIFSKRSRPRVSATVVVFGVIALFGCAGRSTSLEPGSDDDSAPSHGGSGGTGRAGSGGKAGRSGSAGRGGSVGSAGTGGSDVPYVDPGCPDAAAPEPVLECNVFDASQSCPAGGACKPQIEHPYGSGCDQQVINMRCTVPGTGQQGSPCGDGLEDCGDGFICVIGAAHGSNCAQMCPLDGTRDCPSGYVCEGTDADGIGVCG